MEEKIRKTVSEAVSRGKIDIYVGIESCKDTQTEISLNEEYCKSYLDALYKLRDTFGLRDDISVISVSRNSEVFNIERKEEDEEENERQKQRVVDVLE